ncbi:MAG: GNAT family N-acetyltransferase [Clostridia bacterium]|nr:GNAT family N-acetyltransferase [Clostridia bacterium]
MTYKWLNYNPDTMNFVEDWLDDETVRVTGLDDGFQDFYEYWKNENTPNRNFWCKVVYENGAPFAVIAIGKNEGRYVIMELVVACYERNKGKGTLLLKDLLQNSENILGQEIMTSEAVIFPSNPASQRAFEKAGFIFSHAHEDGDALYYTYTKKQKSHGFCSVT